MVLERPRRVRPSSRLGRAIVAVVIAAAIAGRASRAYSHPLHTTLSEVTIASDGGVQIVLRAFVEDFSAAVAGHPGALPLPVATPPDSAAARYLAVSLALTDASGRRLLLGLSEVRRSEDLIWITLRAPALRPIAGARLTNRVLFERWDDQVNIVQTSVDGRKANLLFTSEDKEKRIPLS